MATLMITRSEVKHIVPKPNPLGTSDGGDPAYFSQLNLSSRWEQLDPAPYLSVAPYDNDIPKDLEANDAYYLTFRADLNAPTGWKWDTTVIDTTPSTLGYTGEGIPDFPSIVPSGGKVMISDYVVPWGDPGYDRNGAMRCSVVDLPPANGFVRIGSGWSATPLTQFTLDPRTDLTEWLDYDTQWAGVSMVAGDDASVAFLYGDGNTAFYFGGKTLWMNNGGVPFNAFSEFNAVEKSVLATRGTHGGEPVGQFYTTWAPGDGPREFYSLLVSRYWDEIESEDVTFPDTIVAWSRTQGAPDQIVYDDIIISEPEDARLFDGTADSPYSYYVSGRNLVALETQTITEGMFTFRRPKTLFVFSKDMGSYIKYIFDTYEYDFPSFNSYGGRSIGTVWVDPLGHVTAGNGSFIWSFSDSDGPGPDPDPDPEPEDGAPTLRSWGFTLDNHDFYVSRLGQQDTLVYAARAEDWAPWRSPGSTVWRGHQGFNWLGMSGDNYESGAKTNVVVGDDAEGILWTLDPGSGMDDTDEDPPEPILFTRVVSGGIPRRGRGGARNDAVYLTVDLGNPALSFGYGTTIFLETSDDNGKTWVNQGLVEVNIGGYSQEIFWRSLGLVKAPGRLFRITDYGATLRIDGADIRIGGEE